MSKRIGLKNYPKEPHTIFGLPIRLIGKKYQVWTGKRWYKLEMKTLKPRLNKVIYTDTDMTNNYH